MISSQTNPQLHFRKPVADASMYTVSKCSVLSRVIAIDNKLVGVFDRVFVTITRDVPHAHPVVFLDELAAELRVLHRGPGHMGYR